MLLLSQGQYEEGWKYFEWRWLDESTGLRKPSYNQPTWTGEQDLVGKKILVYGEQGLGDIIQFSRYAKRLSDLGAAVILEVPKPLHKLLQTLSGNIQIAGSGDVVNFFDYQCPLLSLPFAFKTSLTNLQDPGKYIFSEGSKLSEWRDKLGPKTVPRVGLVWRGNPLHKNDQHRSVELGDLEPYLPETVHYFILQKEVSYVDQRILESHPKFIFFKDGIRDFTDTAALVELMDLVISIDTSVAHLSAAMCQKTWILIPHFQTDWRWLLSRSDSPWYSSVRLFRQNTTKNWISSFEEINTNLKYITMNL